MMVEREQTGIRRAWLLLPVLAAAVLGCGPMSIEDGAPTDSGVMERGDASGQVPSEDGGQAGDSTVVDHDAGLSQADGGDAGVAPETDAGPVFVQLSGTVYNVGDGNVVADVTVDCSCGTATITDASGAWSMSVPEGTLSLEFMAADFHNLVLPVDTGDPMQPWADVSLTPVETNNYIDVIDHTFLIEHFGGIAMDAYGYEDSEAGLQAYLDDVGVQYFSASEIVTPNNPAAATDCGYQILLPGQDKWQNIGALALFADQLRILVNEPVYLRNWWRPPCYNAAVGGAAGGDHPDADAVDLDFQSAASRAMAQRYLCESYWLEDIVPPEQIAPDSDLDPRLNMSIGLGGVSIHLGVLSANGRRFWIYGSYTAEPNSGSCW